MGSYDDAGGYDAVLVALHRDGDPRAFEELYNTYYLRLLRFVRKRVHEDHLVEDLAQEAFARAYAKLDDLRDTTRFYPWVASIAKRLIIDTYKGRGKVALVSDIDLGESDSPDARLLEAQDHADLSEAMRRIRGRHREVLELREHDELSYEQIAEKLGVPVTTVPPLLHRARLALRREYLLLKAQEDTAAWVPPLFLLPLVDLLRRIRDRAAALMAYMPDSAALSGSVVALAASVAAVWPVAPANGTLLPMQGQHVLSPAEVVEPQGLGELGQSPNAFLTDSTAFSAPGEPDRTLTETLPVPRQPVARFRREDARSAYEHDRRAPIHIQHGDWSISGDPARARREIQGFLAGDDSWLED